MKVVPIKYFYYNQEPLVRHENGDWIDLRCYNAKRLECESSILEVPGEELPRLKRTVKEHNLKIERGNVEGKDGNLVPVEFVKFEEGDFLLLDLGIAMALPENYEAHVIPRSSTFKNFGLIQVNSIGLIDESYKGDSDRWFLPVVALRDGFIVIGERICQFKIVPKMEDHELREVEYLGNKSRGGHGSSGTL